MKPSWGFTLRGEGTDTLDLDVYDVIGEHWGEGVRAKDVRAALRSAQDAKTIKLKLNTMGGDIFEGLAMYNGLKSHGARVIVEVDGIAASMGSILAMAGDEIIVPKSAWVMIHNPWGFGIGSSEDLRDHADLLDKQKETLVNIYAERTGQKPADIRKWMDAETWMTGDEAVELGFATKTTSKQQSKAALQAFASARRLGFENLPKSIAEFPEFAPVVVPPAAAAGPLPPELGGHQQTQLPDGQAEGNSTEPITTEEIQMADKKNDAPVAAVEATPTIARALGLAAGAPESEIVAAAARCRELEIQITTLTESQSSSEALGAVRELVKTAAQVKDLQARLAKVEGERDEQNFETEISRGLAERKLTPAEAKHERECFARALESGKGAERVEELRGRLKVAATRIGPVMREPGSAQSGGSPPVLEHNGKKYDDMTFTQRARLSKEDPDLYRAMKSDYDERRKSA